MSISPKELRQRRDGLIQQLNSIVEIAEKEDRGLSEDEKKTATKVQEQVTELKERYERLEELASLRQEAEEPQERRSEPFYHVGETKTEPKNEMRAFGSWCRSGSEGMSQAEKRDLEFGDNTKGGYLIPPLELKNSIIKNADAFTFMLDRCNVDRFTGAKAVGWPTLDSDPADADWTDELLTGSNDSTMAVGRKDMTMAPLAKRVKVSRTMLRHKPDLESFMISRFAYKFATCVEKGGLTGSGVNQPLGMFTTSDLGVPSSRNVNSGSNTGCTADGLLNAVESIYDEYHSDLVWIMSQSARLAIRKLKSTDLQYIYQPGLQLGQPSTLLGFPVLTSRFAPSTFTSGLPFAMLCSLKYYNFAISLDFELQRLVELSARTNQVEFIMRWEGNGAPMLPEAFARVVCGT